VVVDLGAVTFIDSTGISVLIQRHQQREATGDQLVVTNPSEPVVRVLEIAGVLEYLEVRSDRADPSD
jgi:stage II sporulation protein AA (anti-sigma F factor antagonist)